MTDEARAKMECLLEVLEDRMPIVRRDPHVEPVPLHPAVMTEAELKRFGVFLSR